MGKELYPNDVVGVRKVGTNFGHDCDEHVFLLGEGSRVQTVARSEQSEALVWQPFCGSNSDRIGQKLSNVCFDSDGGLSDGKQLIDEGNQSNKHQTDDVCTKGGTRHVGIIGVVDNGSDFGVRGIIDDQSGLDLDLSDELCMLLGVDEDILVEKELSDFIKNAVREVGIELVNLVDLGHHVSSLLESEALCFLSGVHVVIGGNVEIASNTLVTVVTDDL